MVFSYYISAQNIIIDKAIFGTLIILIFKLINNFYYFISIE
jgi:hypothetical protein